MALPNVNITLGNGGLGRVALTDDGVAGLILTGTEVLGKLELNKRYILGGTADMARLGITPQTNPLAHKEVKAFYSQAGEGAELHLLIVAAATTLTAMCDSAAGSPLCKLIDAADGSIRIVGVNKIAPKEYTAQITQGIDPDAITAGSAAQQTAQSYADKIRPFRLLMPAPGFKADSDDLFAPNEASYNRVAYVLASDDDAAKSASIGLILGRAAKVEPQQSLGRVKDGSLAPSLNLTNGKSFIEMAGMAGMLHDAGYIIPVSYPTKNGAYLNGNPMAASATDDYSELNLGRIIDKATVVTYSTYISEIMDNIVVDEKGQIPTGVCKSFEGMIENAIGIAMNGQISRFSAYVNPVQNVLSSGTLAIEGSITPLGTLQNINVNLAFSNPALNQ